VSLHRTSTGWRIDWRDPAGSRHRWGSFQRKDAAESFERNLVYLAQAARAGLAPPSELSAWLDDLPPRDRKRLEQFGLLRRANDAPILPAIDEWEASLIRRERVPAHVQSHVGRVRLAVARMGMTTLTDLTPDRVERLVAGLRTKTDEHWARSAATANHYILGLKHFARWCVDTKRLPVDPLIRVHKIAVLERAKVRRALPLEDVAKLIAHTKETPRGWLYRLALETGFRYGELMSLTPRSFTLGKNPTVAVTATHSRKHKRGRSVPLVPSTARELKKWLEGKPKDEPIFAGLIPRPEMAAPLLRADLLAAGVEIAADVTEQGGIDFHSLRHTFCTRLGRTGVDLQTFMSLTGHKTAAVALGYIHDDEGERRKAMAITQAWSGTKVARKKGK